MIAVILQRRSSKRKYLTKCQAVLYLNILPNISCVMFEDKLSQIGFSRSEAKVYLELLQIGPQAVSIIAKRLGMNRSSTYTLLGALEKKGLVSSYINGNLQFFAANDPNCLIGFLDRKCRTFDYYRNEMLALVDGFRTLAESRVEKRPVVRYFEGIEGVKAVMNDVIESGAKEYLAYLCLDKWFESGLKDFLLDFKNRRTRDKGISLRAIAPDLPEVREFFDDNYDLFDDLTQVCYMRDFSNLGIFENGLNIYGDMVSIIHLNGCMGYGVAIESREIANMQRAIFEMAWRAKD